MPVSPSSLPVLTYCPVPLGPPKKDDSGYLTTDTQRLHTDTAALATENLDVELGGADSIIGSDALGKVRLRAESRDGKPVFVGIARSKDVDAYLAGSAHDVVTDVDSSPFHVDYSRRDGAASVAAPASQRIWAASVQGDGRQSLKWKVKDGDWSVVIMNADGSTGVDTGVSAGASLGFLDDAGRIAITTGVVLLIGGLLLLFSGRPRRPLASPLGTTEHAAVTTA